MQQKVIFLDIDGTLVQFDGTFPESARDALWRARRNGHHLVLCTGRTKPQIYKWLFRQMPVSGVVSAAGADVNVHGMQVFHHYINTEELCRCIDFFDACRGYYVLQGSSACYITQKALERLGQEHEDLKSYLREREKKVGRICLAEHPESLRDIEKIAYYHSGLDVEEVRAAAGDYFTVRNSSYLAEKSTNGEVTVKGYDKSFGMRKYLEYTGYELQDTIAFGDGPNDREMLEFAEVGVAMGNASDSLKASANLVTDDISRDGLAKAFERLGLIR